MALASAILTKLVMAGIFFPAEIKPPDSSRSLLLGGAGERGLNIGGQFVTFTAIGVYLEELAVDSLACKWKGKTADELSRCGEFYRDIFTGQFEKLSRVTMIKPLTGQQYSERVVANCITYLKSAGKYTKAEADATKKFSDAFRTENFAPGSSIFFTHSADGTLRIAFSKSGIMANCNSAEIKNRAMSEAVLESIIGEHGVSPAAKKSLASRLSQVF